MLKRLTDFWHSIGNSPSSHQATRQASNLEIVLAMALESSSREPSFPVAFVEFLRTCLEHKSLRLTTVKRPPAGVKDLSLRRFGALLEALADLPTIDLASSTEIALISDGIRSDTRMVESGNWAGDVRSHFEMSSSFGHKGRVLCAVVRFMHCRYCLELGTGYGMSALFMLMALSNYGEDFHLTTLDGSDRQHEIASAILEQRFLGHIRCEQGWTSQALPGLVQSMKGIDFLFHDAGHSRKDYLHDFHAVEPLLQPGSVVVIDDIRWNDPRFSASAPECYKGWEELLQHHRILWAVEWAIAKNEHMGLFLLR